MRVFCPQIAGLCEDGCPYPGDHQCILWDQDHQVCLFRENLKHSADVFRQHSDPHLHPDSNIVPLPGDDKLNKMLKDINLDEE